jgi:GntR family transcriptional regulator
VASADVARRLDLARGDPVLRLQRLRSLGGQPCLLEDIWLPLPQFQALLDAPLADWGDLLYPLFTERCGVAVARATDEIGFAPLSAAQARWLGLAAGHPAVTVTRQAYDLAGHNVELRVTRADAAAFHYTVTIT